MINNNRHIEGFLVDEPLAEVLWSYFDGTEEYTGDGFIRLSFAQDDFVGEGEAFGIEAPFIVRFRDISIVYWLKIGILASSAGGTCMVNGDYFSFPSDKDEIRNLFQMFDEKAEMIEDELEEFEMKYRFWNFADMEAEWEYSNGTPDYKEFFHICSEGNSKIAEAICDDEKLKDICVKEGNYISEWYNSDGRIIINWNDLFSSSEVVFPEGLRYVELSDTEMIDKSNVETVILPESFKYHTHVWFSGFPSLRQIIIKGEIKELFGIEDCSNLETIELPESLEYIKPGCFDGCINLKNIIIPDSVWFINESLFKDCKQLSEESLNSINSKTIVPDDYELPEEMKQKRNKWDNDWWDYTM